jgi:glycosyltransferase involved in cell wall biosynthesis
VKGDYILYKLSICIPTYNRVNYIEETLKSIICQNINDVEIVICDNASSDGTEAIIANYRKKYSYISYFRWDKNMGADVNYIKTIEIAKGEYCWWLGSDDLLEHDAINTMLSIIKKNYNFIYVNANHYDHDMNLICGSTLNSISDSYNKDDIIILLSSWITYISAICIKKDVFMQYIEVAKENCGSMLSFCYSIVNIIALEKNYIQFKPLIRYRSGNTSGYNLFRIFIFEFERLMEYCKDIGYSSEIIDLVIEKNIHTVIIPGIFSLKRGKCTLEVDYVWKYIIKSNLSINLKIFLFALLIIPKNILAFLLYFRKKVKNFLK